MTMLSEERFPVGDGASFSGAQHPDPQQQLSGSPSIEQ